MIKISRKPSSDPAQEKLRQNKSLWNKDVSVFINDLINLKKTMNGAPSKFHPEKGSIKEPIPADPVTIIGVLAGDFDEIAQKGNQIITQQIEYSKNRRKPKPASNLPVFTPATAPPLDLSQQLTADLDYALVAEGSNPITRFFTRLFNPQFGFGDSANLRRARVSMLNASANCFHKLEKFQVLAVKSSSESIIEAHKKLEIASHDWNLVSRAYKIYKDSKSVSATDTGGLIESNVPQLEPQDQNIIATIDQTINTDNVPEEDANVKPGLTPLVRLEQIKNMASDYKKNHEKIPPGIDNVWLSKLDVSVDSFIASRGKKISPDFEERYKQSLLFLNTEFSTTATSFKELAIQLQQKAKQINNPEKTASYLPLEKVSQDFLKRWIGKTRHQLSVFDQTSPFRLNCYKQAGEIKVKINQVMDILEKGLDQEQLDPLIRSINSDFVALRGIASSLYLSTKMRK